uniref:Uncharacterized protein n=1 Tax=Rheinheimera sp. BAL341 TaxID=1708203 RepID=A0A486XKK9_9GAMM
MFSSLYADQAVIITDIVLPTSDKLMLFGTMLRFIFDADEPFVKSQVCVAAWLTELSASRLQASNNFSIVVTLMLRRVLFNPVQIKQNLCLFLYAL